MSRQASGLKAWLWQRLTAVYIGGFLVWFIASLLVCKPADFESWRGWFDSAAMLTSTALFVFAMLIHAWVGMRDILIDYVHPVGIRVTLLGLVGLLLMGNGFWALMVFSRLWGSV